MTKKKLLSHTEILPYLSRVSTFQIFLPKGLCTIRIKFPLQKKQTVTSSILPMVSFYGSFNESYLRKTDVVEFTS